jgi:hypothetical protein
MGKIKNMKNNIFSQSYFNALIIHTILPNLKKKLLHISTVNEECWKHNSHLPKKYSKRKLIVTNLFKVLKMQLQNFLMETAFPIVEVVHPKENVHFTKRN